MSKQSDITLLSMVLILLSASIGILHGRKKIVDPAIVADESARIMLADQDAIDYLQPYLISGNMDSAAATLHQFAEPILFTTLEALLDDKSVVLTTQQKVELLGALLQYDPSEAKHKKIVPILYKRFADFPIFVPFIHNYAKAIPPVIAWAERSHDANLVGILNSWITQSVQRVIDLDDPTILSSLYTAAIRPDKKATNELLMRVVKEKKSPQFIIFLIDQLGGDIKYAPDGKRSLLIEAVETNNGHMVRALLEKGADPSRVLDSKIGTARQIAFERGYAPIELILQENK